MATEGQLARLATQAVSEGWSRAELLSAIGQNGLTLVQLRALPEEIRGIEDKRVHEILVDCIDTLAKKQADLEVRSFLSSITFNCGIELRARDLYELSLLWFTLSTDESHALLGDTPASEAVVEHSRRVAMFAQTLSSARAYGDALFRYGESIDLLRKAEPDRQNARVLASSLSQRGILLRHLNRRNEARADLNQAVSLCRELAESGAATARCDLATTLQGRAVLYAELNESGIGLADYEEAFALAEGLVMVNEAKYAGLLASVALNSASLLTQLNRFGLAIERFNLAIDFFTRESATNTGDRLNSLAMARQNRANCLDLLGRFDEALQDFDAALDIFTRLGDADQDIAMILNNRAQLHAKRGETDLALGDFDTALIRRRGLAAHDPARFLPDVAQTLSARAVLLSDLRRREEALTGFDEAIIIYRGLAEREADTFQPDIVQAEANRAGLLIDLARFREASDAYNRCVDLCRRMAHRDFGAHAANLSTIYQNRSNALLSLGDYVAAEHGYRMAILLRRVLMRADRPRYLPLVATSLINLGSLFERMNRSEEAIIQHNAALALLENSGDAAPNHASLVAMCLQNRSISKARLSLLAEASEDARRAIALEAQHDSEVGWRASCLLADILAQDTPVEALQVLSEAEASFKRSRHKLFGAMDRAGLQAEFGGIYQRLVRVNLLLGDNDQAWRWAERSVNVTLREQFATAPVRLSDDVRRAGYNAWLVAQGRRAKVEVSRHLSGEDSSIELTQHRAEEAQAWQRFLATLSGIEQRLIAAEVPTTDELRKQLQAFAPSGSRTLLIQPFLMGEHPSVVFAQPLWSGELELRTITLERNLRDFRPLAGCLGLINHLLVPPESRTEIAQDACSMIAREFGLDSTAAASSLWFAAMQTVDAQLYELSDTLVRKIEPMLRALNPTHIWIIPHSHIQQLPLHACTLSDGTSLYERYSCAYLPSSTLAGSLLERRAIDVPLAQERFAIGPSDSRLKYSIAEVRILTQQFGGNSSDAFVLERMRVSEVANRAGRLQRLHIAGHALFNQRDFPDSAIQFHDELLTVRQLVTDPALDLRGVQDVFLAICEGGRAAEEAQGLAHAFLRAGAQAVIGGLWSIFDEDAYALALAYHDHRDEGHTPAAAWRHAVHTLRNNLKERYGVAFAYRWASLACFGDAF